MLLRLSSRIQAVANHIKFAIQSAVFRFSRFIVIIITIFGFYRYYSTPITWDVKSCKIGLPSLDQVSTSTYKTIADVILQTFLAPGKSIIFREEFRPIARFFEISKLACSSYYLIVVSALFWLTVAAALALVIGPLLRGLGFKPQLQIKGGPRNVKLEKTLAIQDPRSGGNGLKIETELEKLNALVGLSSVKVEVANIVALERTNQRRLKQGLNRLKTSRHLVFTGNPGTGKTTVARQLGNLLAAAGALRSGHVVETDRSGLVHEYVGSTALKTLDKINQAKGGILFIDEAYSLFRENSPRDFGQEAIDTLIKAMEDYRDDLCVIVAGYSKEMQKFISSNPGLESRFSKIIDFPDYSPKELFVIFKLMLQNDSFLMNESDLTKVATLLQSLYSAGATRKGNGRFVRNLFETTVESQALRVDKSGAKIINEIVFQDVESAVKRLGIG